MGVRLRRVGQIDFDLHRRHALELDVERFLCRGKCAAGRVDWSPGRQGRYAFCACADEKQQPFLAALKLFSY